MGIYIEKNMYIISNNNSQENDTSLVDNTTNIHLIPLIIHPSVHEMMLLTKNATDINELVWFIIMMFICFLGMGGIILMVFIIKN